MNTLVNKPISFNINFDSLNEAFGFPKGYRDPSFFEVFDRFNAIAIKHNFKYSIYIIGKDLANPEIAARVKDWSAQGHEIGNHSWSHPMNLGALSSSEIEKEVVKAHERIYSVTGVEPKGFIAPAWCCSQKIWNILIKYNYLYDTSVFPSILMYPMILKMVINHLKDRARLKKILVRKDWFSPFQHDGEPFVYKNQQLDKSLLILPLPTTRFLKIGYWHTVNFIFGAAFGKKILKSLLRDRDFFYYLLHPADLVGEIDVDKCYSSSLERLSIPLGTKRNLFEECVITCLTRGRDIVLMEDLARKFLQNKLP